VVSGRCLASPRAADRVQPRQRGRASLGCSHWPLQDGAIAVNPVRDSTAKISTGKRAARTRGGRDRRPRAGWAVGRGEPRWPSPTAPLRASLGHTPAGPSRECRAWVCPWLIPAATPHSPSTTASRVTDLTGQYSDPTTEHLAWSHTESRWCRSGSGASGARAAHLRSMDRPMEPAVGEGWRCRRARPLATRPRTAAGPG
jgi:hypothetical protein